MKVTIEEAKQKWCPMSRTLAPFKGHDPAIYNRGRNLNCIATDCIMFEEVGTRTEWANSTDGKGTAPEEVEIFRCGMSR